MTTVFIGGSRSIKKLPTPAERRLSEFVSAGADVVVGDAPGVDHAAQVFLKKQNYHRVRVFCSGNQPRHNVGDWQVERIVATSARGVRRHLEKDRAMAREVDRALMIWDGKSSGTLLNVMRLASAGRPTELLNAKEDQVHTVSRPEEWQALIAGLDETIRAELRTKARKGGDDDLLTLHQDRQRSARRDVQPPSSLEPLKSDEAGSDVAGDHAVADRDLSRKAAAPSTKIRPAGSPSVGEERKAAQSNRRRSSDPSTSLRKTKRRRSNSTKNSKAPKGQGILPGVT